MRYNHFINLSQEEFQKEVGKLSSEEQRKLLEHLEQMSPKKTAFIDYWWLWLCALIGLITFATTFTNHLVSKAVIFLCIVSILVVGAANLSYRGRKHVIAKHNYLKLMLGKNKHKHGMEWLSS